MSYDDENGTQRDAQGFMLLAVLSVVTVVVVALLGSVWHVRTTRAELTFWRPGAREMSR